MRRSARIQGKQDEQNVTSDENSSRPQRKTRSSRSSPETNKADKKPLRDVNTNTAVKSTSKTKKSPSNSGEKSKVTRSGKHFSPYVISCDSDEGVKTVKTVKLSYKKEKETRSMKNKEKMGKTEKRNIRDDLEENKENLTGGPLQQLIVRQKPEKRDPDSRKPASDRKSKEGAVQTEGATAGTPTRKTNKKVVQKTNVEDLPSFSVKNFPGPFFPLDEAVLQFDEDAIKNSLTREEEDKIRRTLARREAILQQQREMKIECLAQETLFNDTEKFGVFKPEFKDIKAQIRNSDAMFGAHVPTQQGRRPPDKFNIMEDNANKHNECKRLYRKKITDSELMAWHRYNMATSSRCQPTEEEPRIVLRYTRRTSPTTDLIWRLNQKCKVPTVDEFFDAELTVANTNKSHSAASPVDEKRVTRRSVVDETVCENSQTEDDRSLVFDPKEFTSSTPVAKK